MSRLWLAARDGFACSLALAFDLPRKWSLQLVPEIVTRLACRLQCADHKMVARRHGHDPATLLRSGALPTEESMIRSMSTAVIAAAFLSLAGCKHKGDGPEVQSPRGESATAVRSIAEARCDREEKCGNIGDGQSYASRDACGDSVRGDWSDELNAYECPHGIVDTALEQCLTAIRNEECGAPFDTLQRITACASSDICAD
jgi:hypothetical protein